MQDGKVGRLEGWKVGQHHSDIHLNASVGIAPVVPLTDLCVWQALKLVQNSVYLGRASKKRPFFIVFYYD